ncbi:MAG: Xaa-Pro peptidase family protein [Deltaproteobacteria bacterium]|nr:Xaa-Pro peptidase family protein [Deltaproteobacteria bacterium]
MALKRIKALREKGLTGGKDTLDALLVSSLTNVRYLSGFTGSNAVALISKNTALLITDSRYTLQARQEAKGFAIRIASNYIEDLALLLKKSKIRRLGFEPLTVSYEVYRRMKKAFKGTSLVPVKRPVEGLRAVKDKEELAAIRAAIKVAEKGYAHVEGTGAVGRAERDVSLGIERVVKDLGADAMSFETIVASGKRSAMPHGTATGKKIARHEFVIVDMGVSLGGYKSDETRTYVTGKPTGRQREIYSIVKDAHDKAIDVVREGSLASEVDRAARAYIEKKGFGSYFGHGTGHGVGLDIHEDPSVGPKSKTVLKQGMVITVEPGIYIPGFGGVRIEDMVLVGKHGPEVLTEGKKELKTLR